MSEPVKADGGGLRYNEGKPPMELVPPEALVSMAEVLRYGEKKYARRNWERGMAWSIPYACALRHVLKWFQGEEKDSESGLSHLDHALMNLAMLVTYERRGIGEDDRPKQKLKEALDETITYQGKTYTKDGPPRVPVEGEPFIDIFGEVCFRGVTMDHNGGVRQVLREQKLDLVSKQEENK